MKRTVFLLAFLILLFFSNECVLAVERISCTVTAQSVPCRVNIIMTDKEDFAPDDIAGFETRVFNTPGDHEIFITPRKNTKSGEYLLIIKNNDKKEVRQIYYASAAELEEILELINKASGSEMRKLIEDKTVLLGVNESYEEYYSYLTQKSKDSIAAELSETEFGSVSDFKTAFREASKLQYDEEKPVRDAVELINDASADVKEVINKYGDILGLDVNNIYGWSMVKDTEYTDYVVKALAGKKFTASDIVTLQKAFDEGCETAAVNCADYLKLERVINSYKDLSTELNMSRYNSLHPDDKTAVMRAVADDDYKSKQDFISAFNAQVLKYDQYTSNSGRSGSSGGGGGSSSAKGNFGTVTGAAMKQDAGADISDEASFEDLEGFSWAEDAVYSLKKKGIVLGRGDNRFDPDAPVTRDEFTAMLIRALDIYDPEANADFDDVPESHWCYSYIASAKKSGIINGRSEHIFGPGDGILRYEAAIMTHNAMKVLGYEFEYAADSFTDTKELDESIRNMVGELSMSGVICGVGNGMFEPYSGATRAQTAVIIYRMLAQTGGIQ